MIVNRGLGSSLLVTKGYGRKYLNPFARIRDFEKSVYKYIEDSYNNINGYPVYYGNVFVNCKEDVWIYCNFNELNVETNHKSSAYVDIISRIDSINSFNTELYSIVDELREILLNANVDLYDFTYSENPQRILDNKILVYDVDRQVYERIEELEFEGTKSLLQAIQISFKVKLLSSFTRNRY